MRKFLRVRDCSGQAAPPRPFFLLFFILSQNLFFAKQRCRRRKLCLPPPRFFALRAFQALIPCRAERFWGQLPRYTSPGGSFRTALRRSAPRRISLSRPFFCFCFAFRRLPRLARLFAQSSTIVHSFALFRRKTRPPLKLLRKKRMLFPVNICLW